MRNGMVKPILISAHQFAKGRRFAVQGRCDELGVFHGQSTVFHELCGFDALGHGKVPNRLPGGRLPQFLAGPLRLPPGQLTRAAEIVKLLCEADFRRISWQPANGSGGRYPGPPPCKPEGR